MNAMQILMHEQCVRVFYLEKVCIGGYIVGVELTMKYLNTVKAEKLKSRRQFNINQNENNYYVYRNCYNDL